MGSLIYRSKLLVRLQAFNTWQTTEKEKKRSRTFSSVWKKIMQYINAILLCWLFLTKTLHVLSWFAAKCCNRAIIGYSRVMHNLKLCKVQIFAVKWYSYYVTVCNDSLSLIKLYLTTHKKKIFDQNPLCPNDIMTHLSLIHCICSRKKNLLDSKMKYLELIIEAARWWLKRRDYSSDGSGLKEWIVMIYSDVVA